MKQTDLECLETLDYDMKEKSTSILFKLLYFVFSLLQHSSQVELSGRKLDRESQESWRVFKT